MSGWRKIVVDGKHYRWRGRDHFVVQDSEGRRVASSSAARIKGWSENDWERACWKGYGSITPSDVEKLIRKSA